MFFLFHCHINVCLFPLKLYYSISTLSWPPVLLRLWQTLTSSFPFHRFTQLFVRLLLNPLSCRYVFLWLFLVVQQQYIFFFPLLPTSRWSPRRLGPALLPLHYLCVPSAFLADTCPDFFCFLLCLLEQIINWGAITHAGKSDTRSTCVQCLITLRNILPPLRWVMTKWIN